MSPDLVRKVSQLNTLIDFSSLINSSLNVLEVRKRATEAAITLADAETGSLLLVEAGTGELVFEVALGKSGELLKEVRLSKGQGIAGWVAEYGEPLIINDVQADSRFFREADRISLFNTVSVICVPVKSKGKTIGVIEAINKKNGFFEAEDAEILGALANQVAVAIENAALYHELRDAFHETAKSLAETIEKRDRYTGGHTQRVMNYSVAVGGAMGLGAETIENLKLAAILHDIGKIGVEDEILLKEGALEPGEMAKMNRHTIYGSEILRHVKQLRDVIPGVRGHHERYDGSGYPDGLKGAEIPLIARIIAVADTFDAMTSDRPYRKAIGTQGAIEELRRNSGSQFDREIVETFIGCFRASGEADAA